MDRFRERTGPEIDDIVLAAIATFEGRAPPTSEGEPSGSHAGTARVVSGDVGTGQEGDSVAPLTGATDRSIQPVPKDECIIISSSESGGQPSPQEGSNTTSSNPSEGQPGLQEECNTTSSNESKGQPSLPEECYTISSSESKGDDSSQQEPVSIASCESESQPAGQQECVTIPWNKIEVLPSPPEPIEEVSRGQAPITGLPPDALCVEQERREGGSIPGTSTGQGIQEPQPGTSKTIESAQADHDAGLIVLVEGNFWYVLSRKDRRDVHDWKPLESVREVAGNERDPASGSTQREWNKFIAEAQNFIQKNANWHERLQQRAREMVELGQRLNKQYRLENTE